jgi:ElaB/YqjD/DUF883 family membrane-anchored ribosome-binding protein
MANVDDEVAKLRKDMDQLRSDISTLTATFKELGVQKGREAVARARKTGDALREEANAWRSRADHEIEQRPFTSVLMSFGIGFLVGMLLDRRH